MTREEAINSITKNAPYTMFQLIHQIYDDFEKQLLSNSLQLTCKGCKWYEVRNHSASCNWCERHPSLLVKNIKIKDYWESKE